jgi:hypothetical protein
MNPIHGKPWNAASEEAVRNFDVGQASQTSGSYATCQLCQWMKAFIQDQEALPMNGYGHVTTLLENEDLKQDILLHLQGIGKYVHAADLSDYMNRDDVKGNYDLKKGISLATAKRWMKLLGYRWQKTPSGQYVDGHERDDVVEYRQKVFTPAWIDLQA